MAFTRGKVIEIKRPMSTKTRVVSANYLAEIIQAKDLSELYYYIISRKGQAEILAMGHADSRAGAETLCDITMAQLERDYRTLGVANLS